MRLSEHDEWPELDVTRQLVEDAADAELYLYPGSARLFTDATLADYDESAARLVLERSKDLLGRWS